MSSRCAKLLISLTLMISVGSRVDSKVTDSESYLAHLEPPTIPYVGYSKSELQLDSSKYEPIEVCSASSTKSYMDYSKITSPSSKQYKYTRELMTINDGLLYSDDGYIGVALGSYFGDIGSKFIFKLSSGVELKLIKVEEKSDKHTNNGCDHQEDKSVIEFVVDSVTNKFYIGDNGYIASGNYNNLDIFSGSIIEILKVLE